MVSDRLNRLGIPKPLVNPKHLHQINRYLPITEVETSSSSSSNKLQKKSGKPQGTFDNFFWPVGLHQVSALKKPPGSTWAHLVANGPPISISTWWMLSVQHPRWILDRLAVLATEEEVPPSQAEAFAPTAIAFPNLV